MTLSFSFLSKLRNAILTPAVSAWNPGRDLAGVCSTASVCRESASNELVLLVMLWQFGSRPFTEGSPGAPRPSQFLPSQQHSWKFNFSVSREVSWWNKFNQLFLFSFGHVHVIFTSFFQSVNLLSAHYFLRVSLKLWQLILRPSKAKTISLTFPPQNVTCPLKDSWTRDGRICKQLLWVVSFKK